ncbi:uncharacterized protein [Nothobranchius furzeri]|uniref:uncharacterized protein n=1 Tax=Nothobranchius furzeri TaxID=105023 RepID=UPI003904C4C3
MEEEEERAESSGSSDLLMKGDRSRPPDFSNKPGPSFTKGQKIRQRAGSPGSSCLSMKSDQSHLLPPFFRNEPEPSDTNIL